MSLAVDGVWKGAVWAPTVWADGVWREGEPTQPPVAVVPGFKMDWDAGWLKGREEKRLPFREDEDAIAAILLAELSNYDNFHRRRSP